MGKIILDPKKFQKQIDAFESGSSAIKESQFKTDLGKNRLESVEVLVECVAKFNSTIESLGQLLDFDTKSMKNIKAEWIHVDSEIGSKTIITVIKDRFKDVSIVGPNGHLNF